MGAPHKTGRQTSKLVCRKTVKEHGKSNCNRAAGELEGARPASNWIGERPKKPVLGFFGYRILPSGKIRARKAQSKKSHRDFFDKLTADQETWSAAVRSFL